MKTWKDIANTQPIVTKMITNMIKRNRVAHAYLFQGQKGTGKEEMSLLLAKSIFCQFKEEGEPCQTCKDCIRITSGNHPDVHKLIPDGASIKKEQILHLQKEFTYTGLESNQKVYIIVDADKMTTNAANRLLKFLEEPNKKTTAILLTANGEAMLDTIRSRCQIMSLQPLNSEQMQGKLQEQGITEANARLFAALTQQIDEANLLNQDEWFAQARKLVVQLTGMLQTNSEEVLLFVQKQWMLHFANREQLQLGLDLLLLWYKDVMYTHIDKEESIIFIAYREEVEKGSMYWSNQDTTAILYSIMGAKKHLEQNVHPTLVMEQLTLQMQR
ncbi:DNA polymerase III subunit delta' [Paraliobacillus quinghaiensis]|uniref:DNA polymerase III subunit delta n=1 Tax=Paraliobacillus quinghaiensis TaxID=470815 RepID=A0A917TTH5_9BACI|nr:DNA polymerase III subunit delta' [Paraliobacillus quinghaiensis]GGM36829.1 DNA polymerase III subunit delta' [Paraliobacillus quinghaiensis]